MMPVTPQRGSIQERAEVMGLSIAAFCQVCLREGLIPEGRIRKLKRRLLTDEETRAIQPALDIAKLAEDQPRIEGGGET